MTPIVWWYGDHIYAEVYTKYGDSLWDFDKKIIYTKWITPRKLYQVERQCRQHDEYFRRYHPALMPETKHILKLGVYRLSKIVFLQHSEWSIQFIMPWKKLPTVRK